MKITKLTLSVVAAFVLNTQALAKVYAVVNNQEITDEDVAMVIRNPNVKFESLPKDTQDNILKSLIERKLLISKALKSGITKSKEYQKALQRVKGDLALEYWLQEEYKKIKISDKELKDFYNKNKSKFQQQAQVKARHILVATIQDAKNIIKELDKAKNKKEKFIELAKTKSTGPSGRNGGDLGWFDAQRMVPAFSKAAFSLKPNTYSKEPVKTQFGYHIIYVEDKKEGGIIPFEKVKDKLRQQLASQKFQEYIKKIIDTQKKKAKITIKN